MNVKRCNVNFGDARGTITDLLDGVEVHHIALFRSFGGAVRGNHYHKESTAYIYVLAGLLRYRWRGPSGELGSFVAHPGDLITIPPLERHSLTMVEDTEFLMLVSGPGGGRQYEGDTVREDV